MSERHDELLIRGGTLVDGSGAPGRRADVLVRGDRIAAVELLPDYEAPRVIDATGMAVAPGFIDTHVHTDMTLLDDPIHECFLRQGVTTVIMGQDGLSYAPLGRDNLAMFRRYLAGLNGDAQSPARWQSVAEYRSVFDRKASLNTAYAFPHAAVRLETVGFRDVPLEEHSLARACAMLEKGFEEGAVAFSTGLSYFPNTYGDTREHILLCEVAAAAGRPYVTHIRSVFSPPERDWLRAGLEEAMDIGRGSGAAVHVSHFGPKPWRRPYAQLLEPVDRAEREGIDVTLELYPYPSGNTFLLIYLPPWAHEGGPDALLELIRSGRRRAELVREIEDNTIPPYGMRIAYLRSAANQRLLGMSIDEIAAERGVAVGEAILQLLDEEELVVGGRESPPAVEGLWERYDDELMTLLARHDYMVGSDGIPVATFPHPRTYGTFPRILRVARESGRLSLEQVIHRMTERPAKRFGLRHRGILRSGAYADVVVFDANEVRDHATYDDPIRHSSGIEHLLVNGELVLDGGRTTGALAGRAVP
jgi:N-acyl-D-amino-acid deacylase